MTDPFRIDGSPEADDAFPAASSSASAQPRVQFGVGPAPHAHPAPHGTNPVLDALLGPPPDHLGATIQHHDAQARQALPVVGFALPPQVLARPVQAQAAPWLTSALSLAEHQRVAALLSVHPSQWEGTRAEMSSGRLVVSYVVPNPQANAATSVPRVVLALAISCAGDAAPQADALTEVIVGVPGAPGLALPVRERRHFADGDATMEVLVPRSLSGSARFTPAQEAALQAMPQEVVIGTGDEQCSVAVAFTDGATGALRAATWTVQRHPVLEAWVLTDLSVGNLDLPDTVPTVASAASTSTMAALQGAPPAGGATNWAFDEAFNFGQTALFRRYLSGFGIAARELPQDRGVGKRQMVDGRTVAKDLLDACQGRKPTWRLSTYTYYSSVPLPTWPNLTEAHQGATLDIRLEHDGSTVTDMSLFSFGAPAASAAPTASSTSSTSTASTTARVTTTAPDPSATAIMGVAPDFEHKRTSGYRKFLDRECRFGPGQLPRKIHHGQTIVDWDRVALDLLQTCALPSGTAPGNYVLQRCLPGTWNLQPEERNEVYTYSLQVGLNGVVSINLSRAGP